jgi:hypothetical protein
VPSPELMGGTVGQVVYLVSAAVPWGGRLPRASVSTFAGRCCCSLFLLEEGSVEALRSDEAGPSPRVVSPTFAAPPHPRVLMSRPLIACQLLVKQQRARHT